MFEWKALQLGNHADILSGFPFPSEGFSQEEGMPLIRIRDLLSDELETYFIGPYSDEFVIDDGDILIGMDGDFNIVRWAKGKALLNQRVCKVFTSAPELDDGYLFWLLGPELQDIHQQTPQTTVKHLSVRDLIRISIEVPPVNEQRLIARILDTLDTQIQKTEALIAKLEKVKEGLLHDLLTRGIDENGRLRPSPEQAPELYKESPLGLIPREWEVAPLGGLLDGIDAGWSPSCSDVAPKEGEWGVLKVSAISTGTYLPHRSKTLPEGLSPIKEIEVKKGDVICVRANGASELVGRTVYVSSTPKKLMLSDKTLRLRPGRDLDTIFLFLLMGNEDTKRQIASLISGSSGQKNLSQVQINSLHVRHPGIDEQRSISNAFSSIVSRIRDEKSACNRAVSLKSGLMDDLLTGRVRVTPLLDQAQATSSA